MKERILQIPSKKYIADYIRYCYSTGEIDAISSIMNITLLNTNKEFFSNTRDFTPECHIEIIVSDRARISNANKTLCKKKASVFNALMSNHIRTIMFQKIKVYMKFDKNIKRAIENALSDLEIDEEHLSYDTVAKYYQRHRTKLGLPKVYKQKFQLCN